MADDSLRKTFDEQDCLRKRQAEGSILCTIKATVVVVLDKHLTTVCSSCLKVHRSIKALQRCTKCRVVRYCSADCQAKDWKAIHKDECPLLETVKKVCPDQPTDFARLFTRSSLHANNGMKRSRGNSRGLPCFLPDAMSEAMAKQFSGIFNKPENCRTLFETWKPLVAALDAQFNTNLRQFGPFMNALADVARMTACFYPEDTSSNVSINDPIAYANFLNKTIKPMCDRNAVVVPVIDPVNGPSLRIQTVKDLQAGEMVFFANAQNLLANPIVLKSKRTFNMDCYYCANTGTFLTAGEILCARCGRAMKYSLCNYESYRTGNEQSVNYAELRCNPCNMQLKNPPICDMVVNKTAKLTAKSRPLSELSEEQVMVKLDEVKSFVNELRPLVAPTSMALGVLNRELADIYERLGRMDRCVEAYKLVIPIVESLMDKYDQNIFGGLARLIVFHLERKEIAEALPYIEKAWTRVQVVPGKESFDFRVMDKLRKAVRSPSFSFEEFCLVEPN